MFRPFKKKPGMKLVTKMKELLLDFFLEKLTRKKHFGNVGALGCLKL